MRRKGQFGFVVAYLAPAFVLFGLFVIWPLIQSFALSLYKWSGLSDQKTFIGLENYSRLIKDKTFVASVTHNGLILLVAGILILAVGLGLAHALQQKTRLAGALRSLFLFPHVMSLVAVAIMWRFIFAPTSGGLANGILGKRVDWLGSKATALPSVTVAFIWYAIGFYVLLFMAGLKQIDQDVNEAAELDGATTWRKFRYITWPMLWPVKRIASIYLTLSVLNVFALVWVMTSGGPDRATETVLTYLYQVGFSQSKFGYASAIAVANFFFAMILTGLVMFAFRKNPMEARP